MERNNIPYLYGRLNNAIIKRPLEETTITPVAQGVIKTPDKGYEGFSKVTIPSEPNLQAENIVSGKSIYGVEGEALELYKDPNLIPENIRENVTVYEGTIAETTGTLVPDRGDTIAIVSGTATDIIYNGETIRPYAFYYYANLNSFIGNSVTTVGDRAFQGATGETAVGFSVQLNNVQTIGDSCFAVSQVKSFTGESVTTMQRSSFSNCVKLQSVRLSDNLSVIPNECFINCNQLVTLDMNLRNIQRIQQSSFSYCSSIDPLDFSNSNITLIGTASFRDFASSRTSEDNRYTLDFRNSSFGTIPSLCFQSCKYIDIYLPDNGNTLVTLENINAFDQTTGIIIHVPTELVDAYKDASNWSVYASQIQGY